MMTDTKPRFNVLPTLVGDNYAAAAKILDETCNAWWDHFGMDSAIVRCLLYAQAYGTFVTQTRWSKIRNDIVVDVIDPRNFYVDPYIMYPEQLRDAEYVILEDFPPLLAGSIYQATMDEAVASLMEKGRVFEEKGFTHAVNSAAQDVMAGKKTEIEATGGDLLRRAREKGIPAPATEMAITLVRAIDTYHSK